MRDSEIKVGDRLRIRDWNDMAVEFGMDRDGDIAIDVNNERTVWFTQDMEYLCGQTFTVREIVHNGKGFMSYISYISEEPDPQEWKIIARMLEPAGDPEPVNTPEDSGGLFYFLLS